MEIVRNEVVCDEFLERMPTVLRKSEERKAYDDFESEIVSNGRSNIATFAADFTPSNQHINFSDDTGDIEENGAKRLDSLSNLLQNVVL